MEVSRRAIHIILIICIIVAVAIFVGVTMQRYEVEGEKNMPFELSKIMIFSTAEGFANEESDYKWDFNIFQNNDIYISIGKNDNFSINEKPQKGEIVIYKPNSDSQTAFKCEEEYEVKDKLEFTGETEADVEKLQIANQGGMIIFRVANKNLHRYKSNDDKTIVHDGTLLAKANIKNEEIKFKISFDLTIELKSEKKYKGTITLELPEGNILKNGQESLEITNFDDVVFKRI